MTSGKRRSPDIYVDPKNGDVVYDAEEPATIDDSHLQNVAQPADAPPGFGPDPRGQSPLLNARDVVPPPFPARPRGAHPPPGEITPPALGHHEGLAGRSAEEANALGGYRDVSPPGPGMPPTEDAPFGVPHPGGADAGSPWAALGRHSSPYYPQGPAEVLDAVPPPPEDWRPIDPELDPATYEAPTFVRPSAIDQVPVPIVEILEGNEQGRSYRVEKQVITIGRGLENDIVLTDIAVSRRHLRVQRDEQAVTVEDLGSGNGTLINGQRLPSAAVSGFDRIELGNTVLRVVLPQEQPGHGAAPGNPDARVSFGPPGMVPTAPGEPPPPAGPAPYPAQAVPSPETTAEMPPAVHPHEVQPGLHQLEVGAERSHGTGPAPMVGRDAAKPAVPRRLKLVMSLLAGAVVLLGIAALVVAFLGSRAAQHNAESARPGDGVTEDQLFVQGLLQAFLERRWEQASHAFESVLALSPGNRRAREYLNQARSEERNEGTLLAARQALAEEQYDDALTTLRTIPSSSVFAAKAAELRIETEERHARALVNEARQLASDGDHGAAWARVDQALEVSPTSSEARGLRRQLEEQGDRASHSPRATTSGRASRRRARKRRASSPARQRGGGMQRTPQPPPAPARVDVTSILALYKSGNFAGAAERAREVAASGADEEQRQKARNMARQIDRFGQAWRGAASARGTREKLSHLENALRLDQQIAGGHYGSRIRPQLRDVYLDAATRGWSSGRYVNACKSALRALKLGRDAGNAQQVAQQCEGKAREYYQRGEAMADADLNQAKALWRKVLSMVPRSSQTYTKAYTSLNNAGLSRYQDEDE